MTHPKQGILRNQRGAALVAMGISMLVFSALALGTVDLARLSFTANEVQTLADVAATAGVRALFDGQSVVGAAQLAAAQNNVDGSAGAIDPPGTVVIGTYDSNTQAFSAGGNAPNAVQANAEKTVTNFIGSVLGLATTRVQKTAIAVYQTTGSGKPTLPLALGGCHFPSDCTSQSCLPKLITVPSTTDNSGWTGLTGGANQQNMVGLIPTPCGSGGAVPTVGVGTNISLSNGDITPLFNAIRCMVCQQNQNEFLIPVVAECNNNFNQTSPITGFATITIDHFHFSNGQDRLCQPGGGSIKGIVISSLFRANVPGGPPGSGACTGCGTGFVTMVN